MLAKAHRFHGHGSLRYLYKNGTSVRSHWITLKYLANPRRKKSRVSVVISKKVHKSAVGRNRIRRRVYELVRQELPNLTGAYDMTFIIISGETIKAEPAVLSETIQGLLKQTPLLNHN